MPTAAKLVAAALFGALGLAASLLMAPSLPSGVDLTTFAAANGALGAVVGWVVAGGRVGTTLGGAVSYGVSAVVTMAVLGLMGQCFVLMLRKSWRRVYDGPGEALVDLVVLMGRNAHVLLEPRVLGLLLGGGALAGLLTEWAGRRMS